MSCVAIYSHSVRTSHYRDQKTLHGIYVKNQFIISIQLRNCKWGRGYRRRGGEGEGSGQKLFYRVDDKEITLQCWFIPSFKNLMFLGKATYNFIPASQTLQVTSEISIWHMEISHLYCIFLNVLNFFLHCVQQQTVMRTGIHWQGEIH